MRAKRIVLMLLSIVLLSSLTFMSKYAYQKKKTKNMRQRQYREHTLHKQKKVIKNLEELNKQQREALNKLGILEIQKQQIDTLRKELRDLSIHKEQQNKTIELQKKEIESRAKTSKEQQDLIKMNTQKHAQKIEKLQKKLADLQKENINKHTQIEEMQRTIESKNQLTIQQQKVIEDKTKLISEEKEKLVSRINRLKKEIENLKNLNEPQQIQIKQLKTIIAEKDKVAEGAREVSEKQKLEQRKEINSLTIEVEKLQVIQDEQKRALKKRDQIIAEKNQDAALKKQEIAKLANTIQETEKVKALQNEQIKSLEQTITKANQTAHSNALEHSNKIERLSRNLEEAHKRNEQKDAEVAVLKKTLDDKDNIEIATLQKDLENTKNIKKEQKETIAKQEKVIETTQRAIEEKTKEMATQKALFKEKNLEKEKQIEQLNKEFNDLKALEEQKRNALINRVKGIIKSLDNSKTKTKEELKKDKSDIKKVLDKLNTAIQKEITDVKQEIKDIKASKCTNKYCSIKRLHNQCNQCKKRAAKIAYAIDIEDMQKQIEKEENLIVLHKKDFEVPTNINIDSSPGWMVFANNECQEDTLVKKESEHFELAPSAWASYDKANYIDPAYVTAAEFVCDTCTYMNTEQKDTPKKVYKKLYPSIEYANNTKGFLRKYCKVEQFDKNFDKPYKAFDTETLENMKSEIIAGKALRYTLNLQVKPECLEWVTKDLLKLMELSPSCKKYIDGFKVAKRVTNADLHKANPVITIYLCLLPKEYRQQIVNHIVKVVYNQYKTFAKEISLDKGPAFNKQVKDFIYVCGGDCEDKEPYKEAVEKGLFENTVYTADYTFFKDHELNIEQMQKELD